MINIPFRNILVYFSKRLQKSMKKRACGLKMSVRRPHTLNKDIFPTKALYFTTYTECAIIIARIIRRAY